MRTGLLVLAAWILLSVPLGILVGRWLARSGKEYPEPPDPGWRDISEYVRTVRREGSTVIPIDRPPVGEATIILENREPGCDCPLARDAERILLDGRLCPYPVDGEDGLCAMCRFTCIPLLKELREGIRRG
jgi:hypothetical protein